MGFMNKDMILLDFNHNYCATSTELLNSETFYKILKSFITTMRKKKPTWWEEYENISCLVGNENEVAEHLIHIFKLLLVFPIDEVQDSLLSRKELMENLVEELYNYWRHFERYAFIINSGNKKGLQKASFMAAENEFSNLILSTYRLISEKIMGHNNRVYRQVSAGSNASFILQNSDPIFKEEYEVLNQIRLIHTIILHSPFIIYPKNTKRKGVFKSIDINPINLMNFNKKDWFCFPLMVANHHARVYFHKDYMNLGLTLANLFEFDTSKDVNIDLILIYGGEAKEISDEVYYQDNKNKCFVGYIPYGQEATYFGYMKKMLLTLHNIANINKNELPIHGAMFSILFRNRERKNIIVMGDSGTGKSETLEALRSIGDKDIADISVIFDDMGSLKIINNEIYGYGSETGAFVRLDDLEPGYAYRSIDRSILLNPDQNNARAVIPITTHQNIVKGFKVDMILYANNYEDKEGIYRFNKKIDAINVFKKGKRMAKSTTNEKGLVESYFANPFGPLQLKDKVDSLIEIYFSTLFLNDIFVGEIYTCLGIEGKEHIGPAKASEKLLNILKK